MLAEILRAQQQAAQQQIQQARTPTEAGSGLVTALGSAMMARQQRAQEEAKQRDRIAILSRVLGGNQAESPYPPIQAGDGGAAPMGALDPSMMGMSGTSPAVIGRGAMMQTPAPLDLERAGREIMASGDTDLAEAGLKWILAGAQQRSDREAKKADLQAEYAEKKGLFAEESKAAESRLERQLAADREREALRASLERERIGADRSWRSEQLAAGREQAQAEAEYRKGMLGVEQYKAATAAAGERGEARKAFEATRGKNLAEGYDKLAEHVSRSQKTDALLDRAEKILANPDVPIGPDIASAAQRRIGAAIGSDTGKAALDLDTIGTSVMLSDVGSLGGGIANKDADMLKSVSLSPSQSREQNIATIKLLRAYSQRAREVKGEIDRWMSDGRSPTDPALQDVLWSKYGSKPLMPDKSQPSGISGKYNLRVVGER